MRFEEMTQEQLVIAAVRAYHSCEEARDEETFHKADADMERILSLMLPSTKSRLFWMPAIY